MPDPNKGPSAVEPKDDVKRDKSKSLEDCCCCFGIASFLLVAASAWLTATTALDGGLENWRLYALVYGAVNVVAGILMIGATMKPHILTKKIFCDRFELGSLAALILTIYDGVSAGLLTFLRSGLYRPINTPLAVGSTFIVAYGTQAYFAIWATFIFAMTALLCMGENVKIPLFAGAVCCGTPTTLFVASTISTLAFIQPFESKVSNAQTSLGINAALAGLSLIRLTSPMKSIGGKCMMAYAFVLMGLAVAAFVYSTYKGPTAQLGNAFFATLIAAFAGVLLFARTLYY